MIKSEKPTVSNQANSVGVSDSSYTASYNELITYIDPILQNMNVNTTIVGNTFRSKFRGYYDNKVILLKNISNKLKSDVDKAQSDATQAKSDAANAKRAADDAVSKANDANSKLADMSNDNLLTPYEKIDVKAEWDIIVYEKPVVLSQASKVGANSTAYNSAYNTLNTYITPLLSNMNVSSVIVGTTFRANFKNYYDAKVALLKSVSDILKDTADSKAQTFKAQPVTPYRLGDLWLSSSGVYQCVVSRASGAFVAADWSLTDLHENTKTVIDGGLITSGTVQLAGDDLNIKAGITGVGTSDESVRIWAGATQANKNNAPFRVLQSGKMFASEGEFGGDLKGVKGSFKSLDCLNANNERVGGIRFDGQNRQMWFSGDMIHQGFNDAEQRQYRFLTSTVWARGLLGRYASTYAEVTHGVMDVYYSEGKSKRVNLDRKTDPQGNSYYVIKLYSPSVGLEGMPIDMIIINNTTIYYYELIGAIGKSVKVVNSNWNRESYIYGLGRLMAIPGGMSANLINVGGNIRPIQPSTQLGYGWMVESSYQNT